MPKHNNGFDYNVQASRRVLQSDNEIHTFQIYTKFFFLYILFFKILDSSFYFILIFKISYIYLYNCLSTDIDFIILEMLRQCGIACFSFFFYISFIRNVVSIYTLTWCFRYIFFLSAVLVHMFWFLALSWFLIFVDVALVLILFIISFINQYGFIFKDNFCN
jgi:hypothetical protein